MPSVPAPADPGWGEDRAWPDRDPMTAAEREAWLDRLCEADDDPFDAPGEYWDPEACAPPPGEDELTGQELAGLGPVDPWPAAWPCSSVTVTHHVVFGFRAAAVTRSRASHGSTG